MHAQALLIIHVEMTPGLDIRVAPEWPESLNSSCSQDELVVEGCYGCTNEGSSPKDPLQEKIIKKIKYPLQSKQILPTN
jgi:hypothetical protein